MLHRIGSLFVTAGLLASCAAAQVSLTPSGEKVMARKDDAPVGALEIGPVEVKHGSGCGFAGSKGSYEGAYALLRNEAGKLGADYVQIMTITGPYSDGQCAHNAFVMRGVAYKLAAEGPTSGGSAAVATQAASVDACSPICSPGYACQAGGCVAQCNPICSPGYACAQDRTCQALPASGEEPGATALGQ